MLLAKKISFQYGKTLLIHCTAILLMFYVLLSLREHTLQFREHLTDSRELFSDIDSVSVASQALSVIAVRAVLVMSADSEVSVSTKVKAID